MVFSTVFGSNPTGDLVSICKIENYSSAAVLTDSHRNMPNYVVGFRKVGRVYIKIYFK